MKHLLLITPEADSQILTIDRWWRTNRPAAPDLFLQELTAAFWLIQAGPEIGRRYRRRRGYVVRRLLLRTSRYHVYYITTEVEVWIIAVWHAQRGVGPPLRIP